MPSNTPYVITGIQAGLDPSKPNEPKPLRQEVDAWYSDPSNTKEHTLFFRALAAFQKIPIHDKLSYWQVAGAYHTSLSHFMPQSTFPLQAFTGHLLFLGMKTPSLRLIALAIAPMEASSSPTGIALMCYFSRYDTILSSIVRTSHFHLY